MATIEELLKSLQIKKPNSTDGKLNNTRETWQRIAAKDSFEELGLKGTELAKALTEFIDNNPYSAISK